MSASKRKGTDAESAVVRFLRMYGFPHAERRALAGSKDLGDITGIPGVVVEVKNHAKINLAGWMNETKLEQVNAKADIGLLVVKRRMASPADWYAVMDLATATYLLRLAGWGDKP